MTLKEIHDFILLVIDKEVSGWATPPEIDSALDRASMAMFRKYLDVYAINQQAQDALAPFKTSYTFTNSTSVLGIVQLPSDYLHFLSATAITFDNETETNNQLAIEIVNSDELSERIGSQLKPVTTNKPIAHWIGKGRFQIHPTKPSAGTCWYLKRPNKPVYAYTQSGRVVTYNAGSSVQLEWGETEINAVIMQALQFLGVNLSDEQMVNYTQTKMAEV